MNRPIRRAGGVMLALALAVTLASIGSVDPLTAPPVKPVEGVATPGCGEPVTDAELFTPAATEDVSSAVAPASDAGRPMRGYCRCTCTPIPNCSTNADCGGGLCLKGPTCC